MIHRRTTAVRRRTLATCLSMLLAVAGAAPATAQQDDGTPYCGNEGVWVQILGSGGPELDDRSAGASYVVFADNRARLLVDMAPGSSVNFDDAGASFADLDAAVFTKLLADHASDFPAYIAGSYFSGRERPLPLFGPDGSDRFPGTRTFAERLIGEEGAFPYLSEYLSFRGASYRLSIREIAATGRQRWAGFGSDEFQLSAIPVHHGGVPGLAWRADFADTAIVFTGDFSNQKDVIAEFAEGAEVLVIHHAIPESARGEDLDLHVRPSDIGRIADRAGVSTVILGQRMQRTRGVETLTRQAITEHFDGSLIFANEQECWGF